MVASYDEECQGENQDRQRTENANADDDRRDDSYVYSQKELITPNFMVERVAAPILQMRSAN